MGLNYKPYFKSYIYILLNFKYTQNAKCSTQPAIKFKSWKPFFINSRDWYKLRNNVSWSIFHAWSVNEARLWSPQNFSKTEWLNYKPVFWNDKKAWMALKDVIWTETAISKWYDKPNPNPNPNLNVPIKNVPIKAVLITNPTNSDTNTKFNINTKSNRAAPIIIKNTKTKFNFGIQPKYYSKIQDKFKPELLLKSYIDPKNLRILYLKAKENQKEKEKAKEKEKQAGRNFIAPKKIKKRNAKTEPAEKIKPINMAAMVKQYKYINKS